MASCARADSSWGPAKPVHGIAAGSSAESPTISNTMVESGDNMTRFDDAMRGEYRALAASIAQQRERAERLQALADHARAQADHDEQALIGLAQVLGLDPQMCLDHLDERLRGQRLQEIAVQVLAEQHSPGEPVHYKQWYGLLRSAGYAVGGKDPLATFLATVSRSPHVRAIGQRSGLYLLIDQGEPADRPDPGVKPGASRRAA
jgi:hypothetical protein